jgi:hypothetical protein
MYVMDRSLFLRKSESRCFAGYLTRAGLPAGLFCVWCDPASVGSSPTIHNPTLSQGILLLFILISSYMLIRNVKDKRKISVLLLAKTYLSTVLAFSGIFALLFLMSSEENGLAFKGLPSSIDDPIHQWASFIYFAFTTMTTGAPVWHLHNALQAGDATGSASLN